MNKKYTKNEPLISIITPVYSRLEWLPLTLQSLSEQTYKNFEIQIVNDCGESPKEILNNFPNLKITYSEHKVNQGLSAARNTGMSHAKGDYFVLLDSDDQLMPLALEFRMSMMRKYSAEIVYSRVLKDVYEKRGQNYVVIANVLYWNSGFNRDLLLVQNISPCNGVMFSRKSWEDANCYKFDTNLKTGEDFDMWQELSRKHDFVELKLLDCSCSYRTDGTQMTGTRNFALDLPKIFSKRRHTAQNPQWVIQNQNAILRNVGLNPSDYGL